SRRFGGTGRARTRYGFAQSSGFAQRAERPKRYGPAAKPGLALAAIAASLEWAGAQSYTDTWAHWLGLELRPAVAAARPCLVHAGWAADSLVPTGTGATYRLVLAGAEWFDSAF